MSSGGRLQRNPEIVWRDEPAQKASILEALERGDEVDDKGWVILVSDGQMVELNLLAGEIWRLADGSRDTQAIAEELAAQYDASPQAILADVEEFVGDCLDRGWLQKVTA